MEQIRTEQLKFVISLIEFPVNINICQDKNLRLRKVLEEFRWSKN